MSKCYLVNYSKDNIFYKKDIISLLINNGINKSKLVVFNTENAVTKNIKDDINMLIADFEIETDLPEYYKCYYDSNTILYINEYNIIVRTDKPINIKMFYDEPILVFLEDKLQI